MTERLEPRGERLGLRVGAGDDDFTARARRARGRARRDRRRCAARATSRPRRRSAPVSVVPSWYAATGARQPPPTAATHRALGLDAAPRLGVVGGGDEMLLARAHLKRERALRRLRQELVRVEAVADLARRARAGRARRRRARPRRARARRACAAACRCCRAAARSRASARARAAAPCGAPTPCRCASPAGSRRRRRARRADRRAARYAPTTRPVRIGRGHVLRRVHGDVDAAARAAPPRAPSRRRRATPISPNGFVRSRSPAVVIGTSAISIPGARRRGRGELGLREREPTAAAADADQHSATRFRDGLAAQRGAARPHPHERGRHLQRQRPSRQLAELQRSSSPRPNRCRTASA